MWAAQLPEFGALWNCPSCCISVDERGAILRWREPPRIQRAEVVAKEEKFRSNEPCPRCGQGLWIVEVPNYGSRKQCENCRITIMFGNAIMEWSKG
ncbi:MAG TPA: hypothetical protein VHJ82_09595 [Actinomycetota bacterium]|nr:hypothetical protein [Actinomycetota bacterium]